MVKISSYYSIETQSSVGVQPPGEQFAEVESVVEQHPSLGSTALVSTEQGKFPIY